MDGVCTHEQQHVPGIPHHRDLEHEIRIKNAETTKGVRLGRGREGQLESLVALRALLQVLEMFIHPVMITMDPDIPAAEGVVEASKDGNVSRG